MSADWVGIIDVRYRQDISSAQLAELEAACSSGVVRAARASKLVAELHGPWIIEQASLERWLKWGQVQP
jgi:hypothetical protein